MLENPSPQDYSGKARDPKWERELLEWLRAQSEDVRFTFLMELMNYHGFVALTLAHNSLQSRSSFIQMLEFAVKSTDASSIRYWLDCVVPRLGFRRAADQLLRLSETEMPGVFKAMYWLPRYVSSEADGTKLDELRRILGNEQRG
jgi:hypothetical protein